MEKIENKIKEMSSENIIAAKPNPILPVAIGVLGLLAFIVGIINITGSKTINVLLLLLGIGLFVYAIIAILGSYNKNSRHFIYQPTGKKIKKYQIYTNHANMQILERSFQDNNFHNLKKISRESSANKMLTVMAPDDASIVLAQISEYIPHHYEPVSPVYILKGENAKLMLDFCKS